MNSSDSLSCVRKRLVRLIELESLPKHRVDRLTVHEHARAGELLGWLGDPRPGVGLRKDGLPDICWIRIRAGRFRMGNDRHWETIPNDFWISRYPITVAQYGAFIRDGVYEDDRSNADTQRLKRWWGKEGLYWKRNYGIKKPAGENIIRPHFFPPNHPQVGVSWLEAVAFCRWFEEKSKEPPWIHVRLPTEMEWERVARHTDGREYPWGNEEIGMAQLCNIAISGSWLGTTAVGAYPSGSSYCKVLDMAGNAWEWCSTPWVNKAHGRIDSWEPRVLRGSSWCQSDPKCVRCAFRWANEVDYRDEMDCGFRVAATLTT